MEGATGVWREKGSKRGEGGEKIGCLGGLERGENSAVWSRGVI